jgi:Ca2+-binding RTX toxin-like protein
MTTNAYSGILGQQANPYFDGDVPPGFSAKRNAEIAKSKQDTLSPIEALFWFYDVVRNNAPNEHGIRHMELWESMDYHKLNPKYENFGNYNYGYVGRAMGIPREVLLYGAGINAQVNNHEKDVNGKLRLDENGKMIPLSWPHALWNSFADPINKGDNKGDQYWIQLGMDAADAEGISRPFSYWAGLNIDDRLWLLAIPLLPPNLRLAAIGLGLAFKLAEAWVRRDPIILDLDGDGVETLDQASGCHFDHDGNGFAEQTGWVGADDGLLIRDRQQGAEIAAGSQLFGDFTLLSNGKTAAHGFEALADLDDNHDGVIDQADAAWAELAIWKDANSDAYFDPGERLSLEQAGIRQLLLAYRHGDIVDGQGNQHLQLGSYLTSQGQERAMEDIGFSVDLVRTEEREILALDSDIGELPNIAGIGNVHSLHQAIQRDTSGALKLIVQQWTQSSDEEKSQLIRPLIFHWTGVYQRSSAALSGLSDGRILPALEAFFGRQYRNGAGIQGEVPARQLEQIFNDFADTIAVLLDSKEILAPIFSRLDIGWNEDLKAIDLDVQKIAEYLVEKYPIANSATYLKKVRSCLLAANDFGAKVLDALRKLAFQSDDETRPILLYVSVEKPIIGSINGDSLAGGSGNDFIDAASGDDRIQAGDGADYLFGGAGNDTLLGEAGADVIEGGRGDDVLVGGSGDDVYVFGRGDGQDVIGAEWPNWWERPLGHNVLMFKADIAAKDVSLTRREDGLVVSIEGTADTVTASNFFRDHNPGNQFNTLQEIRFADGSSWDVASMLKEQGLRGSDGSDNLRGSHWIDLMRGLGGDDYLYGYGSDDRLFGDSGNDQLWGGEGEDQLDGGAGNDTLLGEAGADVIEGGRGDDVLVGGSGDDVYVFGRGDGQDVIGAEWPNWWERPLGHNVLMFKADIAAKDVSLTRREDGLVVSIEGTADTVTASNFFRDHNPGNQFNTLQEIRFADGSSWDVASMLKEQGLRGSDGSDNLRGSHWSDLMRGLGGDDYLYGYGSDDRLFGDSGNDQLWGGEGEDQLDGGAGNDTLLGEAGADVIEGGRGDDVLVGGSGDDVYVFGRGDGQDVIGAEWPNWWERPLGHNVLMFKADIAAKDVSLTRRDDGLVVSIEGTEDTVTASNFSVTITLATNLIRCRKSALPMAAAGMSRRC